MAKTFKDESRSRVWGTAVMIGSDHARTAVLRQSDIRSAALRAPILLAAIGVVGRRFAYRRSGIVSIELALLVPLLTLFLFGIIHFTTVLFAQNHIVNAAWVAGRSISVGETTYSGSAVPCESAAAQIVGSAEDIACTFLANWGTDFTVHAFDHCPAINDVTVRITMDASTVALSNFFGFFSGRTLGSDVTVLMDDVCP